MSWSLHSREEAMREERHWPPLPDLHLGDAVQPMVLAEGAGKQLQSLHEAQPSFSKERIHSDHEDGAGLIGPSFSPADLAKTGPEPCPRQRKKDAPESLVTGNLGDHGSFLLQRLLEVLPLRSQPKGRTDSRSLFPLPSSRSLLEFAFPDLSERELDWLRCVVISLNSLWGGDLDSEKAISSSQKACLAGLARDVSRFCALDVTLEDFSWDEFFKVKSVDYRGEEVKVARWFSWNNIAPALPREIGTVPLADVCELGCKFYVENFEAYLKPRHEWKVTKPPRVMVSDDDWGPVCTGLVQSGVCCFLEDCDVFHVGTEPLLNGLFGVSKDETSPQGFENLSFNHEFDTFEQPVPPFLWWCWHSALLGVNESILLAGLVKGSLSVPKTWSVSFTRWVCQLRGWSFSPSTRPYRTMCFLSTWRVARFSWPRRFYHWDFLTPWAWHSTFIETLSRGAARTQARGHGSVSTLLSKSCARTGLLRSSNPNWRVYLDNYDLLERVEATDMVAKKGSIAPGDFSPSAGIWEMGHSP